MSFSFNYYFVIIFKVILFIEKTLSDELNPTQPTIAEIVSDIKQFFLTPKGLEFLDSNKDFQVFPKL